MKRFFPIGWLLIAAVLLWNTEAQACSCDSLSRQQLRDQLPWSFDGRVIATRVDAADYVGMVKATVTVLRKIKGEVRNPAEVVAYRDTSIRCNGVGDRFERLEKTGQVIEFGAGAFRSGGLLLDIIYVSMCTLSYSELDPTKGKGLRLWRRD